ncbi:MAG: peptide deformylase, partial [Thermus sp.]
MIYPIRLYGDPVLRKRARPVQDFKGLKKLAEDMLET